MSANQIEWRNQCEQILINDNILANLKRKPNGEYFNCHTENYWNGFLAAKRSQPVVELPDRQESIGGYQSDEVHDALDFAGIQYRIKGE